MRVAIANEKKISGIQKEFSSIFPFLKIEFFYHTSRNRASSEKQEMIDKERKIGEVRKVHNSVQINIEPYMTVSELKKKFLEMYGLSVQVFRKSGNVWLQSTATDDWSLYEQNKQGKQLSVSLG